MSISEDDEFLQKCEWCGKSGINVLWSGKKGLYCSFRCNAAGGFRTLVLISVISLMLTGMVGLLMIMMLDGSPTISQVDPILIILLIILPGILVAMNLIFIYAVYIGRLMRKERNISL